MTKVEVVKKARRDQGKCGKCGKEIKIGDSYQHASPGFRGRKLVRCLNIRCRFLPSDLTTSKMADVYAAQEDAHDQLDGMAVSDFEDVDDINSILSEVADRARAVAEEYEEAAEAMGGAGEENRERAETIESWCSDLESVYFDDPPEKSVEEAGEEEREEVEDAWKDWRDGAIDAAREALGALEL